MKKYLKITLYSLFAIIYLDSCSNNKSITEVKKVEVKPTVEDEKASIYLASGKWTNQNGKPFELKDLKGKVPVVAMVFTSCGYSCPRMVDALKNIEKQVPATKKDDVVFVLVSFDSAKDTPEVLKAFAKEKALGKNWILLHGEDADIRELSMLLDVKYEKQPNGLFAHSNVINLLNRAGAISARVEGLNENPEAIVKKLRVL